MTITRRRFLAVTAGIAAALGGSAFWASLMKTYNGPVSDHFDGLRFFDPHGSPPKSLGEVLRWQFGGDRERHKWPDWAPSPHADTPPPRELHPFREIAGPVHTAVSTPGDLLFHIRAERGDFTFEFERQLLDALGDAVQVVDEVTGFRYFDARDLLGFVDGTANPAGGDMAQATTVGDEDPDHAGGSYVVVQKYLHDLSSWNRLPVPSQEGVIGRTKVENIELPDAEHGQKSHKTLATIVDEAGVEHEILRDNMPFGRPGQAEFGTYFIGYSRALWVIERMLERMFVGDPAGSYDRILDFSTATTGSTFFAPTRGFLESLGD